MALDDRLLRQMHQERAQAATQERLALAARREAQATQRCAARPERHGPFAGLFRRTRPVARPRGA